MKKKLFLICSLLCTGVLMAQTDDNKGLTTSVATSMNRSYIRPTITRIYITDGSQYAEQFVKDFSKVQPEKYNTIEVRKKFYKLSEMPSDMNAWLEQMFKQEKVANQIMHGWFPEYDNTKGAYSTKTLLERGSYAMTDEEVLAAKSGTRSMETVAQTLGLQLIDRSYVICFVINQQIDKNGKTTGVNIRPYVYKLDYGAKVSTNFQRNYFKKSNGIDECSFPLEHVLTAKKTCSASIPEKPTALTWEEAFDNSMVLVNKIADFQVKATVTGTSPIAAKIGKKEGLYVDKRFNVVRLEEEMITDKDGNTTTQQVAKRRATVRVKKVFDNRGIATGETEGFSSFYKTRGYRVREGYTLVENSDIGMGISVELSYGHPNITIDYRLGRYTNIPGLIGQAKVGLNLGATEYYDGLAIMNISAGFGKEFNFAPFIFTPSVEGGKMVANVSDDYEIELGYFAAVNAKLGFYMTQSSQLYLTAGYYLFLSDYDFTPFPLNVGLGYKFEL